VKREREIHSNLLSFLNELMPFIYTGKYKPTFSEDKKKLSLIKILKED